MDLIVKELQGNASKPLPKTKRSKKTLPEQPDNKVELPALNVESKLLPADSNNNKELPKDPNNNKPLPPDWNPLNVIIVGGEPFLIKPTKLKYQRDRTAAFYRVVLIYPLPDILAMDQGYVDPDRDGDKCLYDWIIAVVDDIDYVKRHYELMDAEVILKMLSIFKRLNKIDLKELQAKNRRAKEQNH